jgi:hypothetical protein
VKWKSIPRRIFTTSWDSAQASCGLQETCVLSFPLRMANLAWVERSKIGTSQTVSLVAWTSRGRHWVGYKHNWAPGTMKNFGALNSVQHYAVLPKSCVCQERKDFLARFSLSILEFPLKVGNRAWGKSIDFEDLSWLVLWSSPLGVVAFQSRTVTHRGCAGIFVLFAFIFWVRICQSDSDGVGQM